jgi:hypothetical protein
MLAKRHFPWTVLVKPGILRVSSDIPPCGCSSVDRVLASEAKGRWFDPSQPHQCFSFKSTSYRLAVDSMNKMLATTVCVSFLVLALWHFLMAFRPATGESAAVPSVQGKPLFVPSPLSAIAVGIVLVAFASLVAVTGGLMVSILPPAILVWLSYGLALGLLARAIGDFKYVGFFKRVRESRFARLDTWIYSPLCVLLCLGVTLVAINNAG